MDLARSPKPSRNPVVATAASPVFPRACEQGSAATEPRNKKMKVSAEATSSSNSKASTSSAGRRQSTVITYGSDCSGLGTNSIALRRAALPGQLLKHEFACEKLVVARRVLRHGSYPPALLYRDIASPGRQRAGAVDVYTAGPPCQPRFASGENRGDPDKRCLLSDVVRYIRVKQPKLFVIQTVKNLLSNNHKDRWAHHLGELKAIKCGRGSLAYNIRLKVLNSKDFGLAQHRERVYVVGCHRSVASRKFEWPARQRTPALASFLDLHPPAIEKKLSATNQRNIAAAVGQVKAVGLDPSSVDMVVDIGCSLSRTNMMHNRCPAITKTRAAGRDFWLMSEGRRLSFMELLRLQGFSEQDLNLDGVSERQAGQMVGNAMSVPVLSAVLKEGLSVCGMR